MNKTIDEILDLKSNELIDSTIADRQKDVIVRGYDMLRSSNENYLYIADEVGLGKTYVAMGIMSLLRHFSDKKNYVDMIIVPKANLQYKWQKEINNFIRTNYRYNDSRVKTILGTPIGSNNDNTLFEKLVLPNTNNAAYLLYRMTSFSISVNYNNWNNWINELRYSVENHPEAMKYFAKAEGLGYFREDKCDIQKIKRLYAYLLNLSMVEIDCLVVDEAHNYRKGNLGYGISARNMVTSCLFGIKNEFLMEGIFSEDESLKEEFFNLVIQKAKKVILLSATPINSYLGEIKNQIDCFVDNTLDETNIEVRLPDFMIRGIMNFKLSEDPSNCEDIFSRNQYRHEHRSGGVKSIVPEQPQRIDKYEDAITFGLFQYKLLRELQNPAFNKSFEIGMLTGFETYKNDTKRKLKGEGEFEETNSSSQESNKSVDYDIVKGLINSYQKLYSTEEYPNHPKQDNLVNELFELIKNQRKGLVFVRRVSSAYELEQRLLRKYEDEYIYKGILEKLPQKFSSSELGSLKKSYVEKAKERDIEQVYSTIFEKFKTFLIENDSFQNVFNSVYNAYYELIPGCITDEFLKARLFFSFVKDNHSEFSEIINDLIGKQRYPKDTKSRIQDILLEMISQWYVQLQKQILEIDDDLKRELNDSGEQEKYFFNSYFSKNAGLAFKNRVRVQDWFEFNYFLLNEVYFKFPYQHDKLSVVEFDKNKKRNQIIDEYTDKFINSIDSNYGTLNTSKVPDDYKENTFLTKLIIEQCNEEFKLWVDNIKSKYVDNKSIFTELSILEAILKNIFRNGSGQLPAFIADKASNKSNPQKSFDVLLQELITKDKYFKSVLNEIKTVINNYTILRNTNFSGADNIDDHTNKINNLFRFISPVIGTTGQDSLSKRRVAAQFRLPGYPYVLITTDILKEGEDLHTFCKNIYHYGIAWNPIDMEQRTGRIDRIGSYATRLMRNKGEINYVDKIQIFFPYLKDTVEVNQVVKVFESMDRYIHTFNDFTVKFNGDSKVRADEVIMAIPPQITEKLSSKYEYKSEGLDSIKSTPCLSSIKSEHELIDQLNSFICDIAMFNPQSEEKTKFSYSAILYLYSDKYQVYCDCEVNDVSNHRKAPFHVRLYYNQDKTVYQFIIYSKIGKTTPAVTKKIKEYSAEFGEDLIRELNDNLYVRYDCPFDADSNERMTIFLKTLYQADYLQYRFIGGDEDV